jgi:hypothetical protein
MHLLARPKPRLPQPAREVIDIEAHVVTETVVRNPPSSCLRE